MFPLVLYPPPPYFEAVYCFICGRRRVAVARYRMICLVLIGVSKLSWNYFRHNMRNIRILYFYVIILSSDFSQYFVCVHIFTSYIKTCHCYNILFKFVNLCVVYDYKYFKVLENQYINCDICSLLLIVKTKKKEKGLSFVVIRQYQENHFSVSGIKTLHL